MDKMKWRPLPEFQNAITEQLTGMKDGDVCEVEVEHLGILRNTVVMEA